MEIREIFLRCAGLESGREIAITLLLRGGAAFRGKALGIEGETWALSLEENPGECLYVDGREVIGLLVHAEALRADWPVEFGGQEARPGAEEMAQAKAVLDAVVRALGALPAAQVAAVRSLRILRAEGGRIVLQDGVLEVSYSPDMAAPEEEEWSAMLGMILPLSE